MPTKRNTGSSRKAKGNGKKKNHFWKIFAIIVALMALFSIVNYVIQIKQNKEATFAHYKDFGIDLPENFVLHGIDVSNHQGKINWPLVKSMESENVRIGFAFIKATEGLQNVDKSFTNNWKGATINNIPHGAYHFFIPGKSGLLQAHNFIQQVHLNTGNLPPVADIEQLYGISPSVMRQELMVFLSTIQDHYGVTPIIYTYASFYNQYLDGHFDNYPFWVAHYFEEKKPRVQRHWDFWQHSENGHVYGISGNVDFSVYSGDSTDFKKLLVP